MDSKKTLARLRKLREAIKVEKQKVIISIQAGASLYRMEISTHFLPILL